MCLKKQERGSLQVSINPTVSIPRFWVWNPSFWPILAYFGLKLLHLGLILVDFSLILVVFFTDFGRIFDQGGPAMARMSKEYLRPINATPQNPSILSLCLANFTRVTHRNFGPISCIFRVFFHVFLSHVSSPPPAQVHEGSEQRLHRAERALHLAEERQVSSDFRPISGWFSGVFRADFRPILGWFPADFGMCWRTGSATRSSLPRRSGALLCAFPCFPWGKIDGYSALFPALYTKIDGCSALFHALYTKIDGCSALFHAF